MSQNSKRQKNRLHIASLLRGIILTVFLGLAGLSYVYLKNQLDVCGAQRKMLEQELNGLIAENNVMEAQISRLTSRTVLQRRLDEGFVRLVPITAQSLVRVHPAETGHWNFAGNPSDNQLQTVSHDTAARR